MKINVKNKRLHYVWEKVGVNKTGEITKVRSNCVSKDKIREMLKELEDRENKKPVVGYWSKRAMLEKLLKE